MYGTTTNYDNAVTDQNFVIDHNIVLSNLTPNTLYHYMIVSTDVVGSVLSSADMTFRTTGPDTSGIVSDDFSSELLNTDIWTFVDPVGDCDYTFVGTGTEDAWLRLHVPAGVDHDIWAGNRSARVMQDANDADFEVEAKFETTLTDTYQIQGIIIEQDPNNYLRFDFHYNNGNIKTFVASFIDGNPNIMLNTIIPSPNGQPMYMRINRIGDLWTVYYSYDANQWDMVISFSHPMAVSSVGPMAGNAIGATSPEFTCDIDYFFNTSSPIVPEDPIGLPFVDDVADSDIPVSSRTRKRTISGSYIDTQTSNDGYESITERESRGKPANRYSYLEHKWTINVTGGDTVTFFVEAYHTANTENDDFVLAYSTDDSIYTDIVTVTKIADDNTYQSYALPSAISGIVYIRVVDTDQTAGNRTLDTIYVDHMYITSE